MKLIRPCPNCKIELRFPIDKGTVKITCPNCKHEFLANPDNPELYLESKFDFKNSKQNLANQKLILTILFYLILALGFFFLIIDFNKILLLIHPSFEESTPEVIENKENEI